MFIAIYEVAAILFTDPLPMYQTVISEVTGTLSEAGLTGVLTYAIGAAVGMVFFWWAVRKCAGIIKRAFKSGKLRI